MKRYAKIFILFLYDSIKFGSVQEYKSYTMGGKIHSYLLLIN
jgi:hypothetical protein